MERKFTEQEQGHIFSRAIALQREAGHVLTLDQMEATALEAGIDPQFLRAAISELEQGGVSRRADMLPRWRGAALSAVALAQIYSVSGQVLSIQREFYIQVALAALVGAVFAGRGFLKGLGTFLAVSVATACLTAGFVLAGADVAHLPVAIRQAFTLLLIESLSFTVGHLAASAFLKPDKSAPIGFRDRLEATPIGFDETSELAIGRRQSSAP